MIETHPRGRSRTTASQHCRRIIAIVDEFDLVCFRLDKRPSDAVLAGLRTECVRCYVLPLRHPYLFRWKWTVAVVRPSHAWLHKFCDLLSPDVTAELYYAEVARDFITATRAQAFALHLRILGSMSRRRFTSDPVRYKTSTYYGPRRDTVALYHSRGHKGTGPFNGYPCMHIEIRIAGKEKLSAFGLARPHDLIDYNFEQAWDRACTFYSPPEDLRRLGSLLGDGRRSVGDHARRKRARSFLNAGKNGDNLFLLHSAVRRLDPGRIPRAAFSKWIRANVKISANPLLI